MGDVEVGIREGTAAWLDVNARAGKVHNALTAADARATSGETGRGARAHVRRRHTSDPEDRDALRDHGGRPAQVVRRPPRARRRRPRRRRGDDLRAARPERGGQDDHRPDPLDPDRRRRRRAPGGGRGPRPGPRRGPRGDRRHRPVLGRGQPAHRPGEPDPDGRPAPPRPRGGLSPRRRTARAVRPRRGGRQAGRGLLRWHAAPARPGDGARRRPADRLPRRTDHRPGPAQPAHHVGHHPRPRRPAA